MEGDSKTYVFNPDSGMSSAFPWLAMNNNGFGGAGGWGGGILGFLLGALFGGGWGGNGFGFGGNNLGGAGYVANALNNDTGRDLILQAVNGNHEAVSNLSNILHADVESVQAAINSLAVGLSNLSGKTDFAAAQTVNAIQAGNAALTSKLADCCCQNKLLSVEQGYQSQIATLNQTNQLGAQADRNANAIIGAINAQTVAMNDGFCQIKERELQAKIDELTASNTLLRGQIDNAQQTQAFAAMLAPINAKLIEIENRQPATVPVVYPNLIATPVTPTTTTNG